MVQDGRTVFDIPVVFNVFINVVGSGTEYTLSSFAGDTKLSGVVDTHHG